MSEITKESRAERAIACHNKAYNCAQSVAFHWNLHSRAFIFLLP